MKEKSSRGQLTCWVSEEEYTGFMRGYKNSLCRSKSEYFRKILLSKPITITYRNRSLDDFIETAVQLRRDWGTLLEKIGFSQTEKKKN